MNLPQIRTNSFSDGQGNTVTQHSVVITITSEHAEADHAKCALCSGHYADGYWQRLMSNLETQIVQR